MRAIKLVTVITLFATMAFGQAKKGPLDKKTYACDITEEGKKKPVVTKDELKFATGKFTCKTLTLEGYKQVAYEAEIDSSENPPVYTFKADAPGEKEESFTWEGTVTGDEISGTATITKKGKIKKSYSFVGTVKGKKVK